MSVVIPGILLAMAMATLLGLLTLWRRRARRRAVRRIGEVVRHAPDVGVRVTLYRARAILGMDPSRAHTTSGDLAISATHLLLATDRGILLDIGPDHGRRFTAVRCTGPGRLVLEGEAPSSTETPGLYRFELTVDGAADWVDALRPFARADAEVSVHPAARRAAPTS